MVPEIKLKMTKRYPEFDIARGVAIILMILQHSWLLIFSNFANNPYLNYFFFNLGTVLAAPVFLFLMGANIINSRRNNPRDLVIRGFQLIFLGYILSALRFFLPIILGQYFGVIANPENIIYKVQPIYYLLEVDILQVAGLSLLGIALLKWRKVKYESYLLLALVVSLISPLLWQLNFSDSIFKYLFDSFFGTNRFVVFPFFPWFFYPLVGVYFGDLLLKTKNKVDFYKSCFIKLIPVIIFGFIFFLISFNFSGLSYSQHGIGSSLLFVSIVIYWLAIIYLNYQKLSIKILNALTFLSKNVTLIYFIQWLLIAWTAILISIK